MNIKPLANVAWFVICPLVQCSTAEVAHPVFLGLFRRNIIDITALAADPPARKPVNDPVFRDAQMDHMVKIDIHLGKRLCLADCSRISIKDESIPAIILGYPFFYYRIDDVIRDKHSHVDIFFGLIAKRQAKPDRSPQDVSGRDLHNAESLHEIPRNRALAASRKSKKEEYHPRYPSSSVIFVSWLQESRAFVRIRLRSSRRPFQ